MGGYGALQKPIPLPVVLAAIDEANGNASAACKALGISRTTLYKYGKVHPEIKERLEEVREETIDAVEHVLVERALAGEAWAVCFYLKTQAKHRGYTERTESVRAVLNVDVTKLSEDQLRRLAAGEDPSALMLDAPTTIEGEYVER